MEEHRVFSQETCKVGSDVGRWYALAYFPSLSLMFLILGVEVVAPSPACRRALKTVVNTLQNHGHNVVSMFVEGHIAVQ